MHTPWGDSDYREQTPVPGVTFYSTPSHGGYHVADPALERIPPQFRESKYTPGWPGWFEEDCDWAIVAVFIPEAFTPPPHDCDGPGCHFCDPQGAARATLERYRPEVLAYTDHAEHTACRERGDNACYIGAAPPPCDHAVIGPCPHYT